MKMRRYALFLVTIPLWLFGARAVIYDDFAYIKEKRSIEGAILSPLPKRLQKDTLYLSCSPKGYRYYGAKSIEQIIKESLRPGMEVRFLRDKRVAKGEILSLEPLVIKSEGRIFFDVGYRDLVLKEFDPARLRPHIELFAPAKSCELEYLSGGFGARAFYVARLDGKLRLEGFFAIKNSSGYDLEKAKLSVVMGDVKRASRPPVIYPKRMMAMESAGAPEIKERGAQGLHRYDLAGRWDLADGQELVALYLDERVDFATLLELRMADLGFNSGERTYRFGRVVEFTAPAPLPAGVVRLYGEGLFLGADRISHTPKGEKVRLVVGRDFDVGLKKRVLEWDDTKKRRYVRVRYTITNPKNKSIRVRIIERLPYARYQIRSDRPYKKLDARTIAYELQIPAKGEVTFEAAYTFSK